jgi:type IV fimbrial biogenesis protein FimT
VRIYSGEYGQTLAEVLLTMSILTALLAMAVPEMSKMVATVRLRSAMSALADGLRRTRFEAIKSNARVVMCKSADGAQCTSQGDWAQGWVVFQDTNNNGLVDLDLGERIWYRELPMSESMWMSGNTHIQNYVSYTSFGRSELLSGAFQAGTFTVCLKSSVATDAYSVIINNMGRPRVQKTVVDHCG